MTKTPKVIRMPREPSYPHFEVVLEPATGPEAEAAHRTAIDLALRLLGQGKEAGALSSRIKQDKKRSR